MTKVGVSDSPPTKVGVSDSPPTKVGVPDSHQIHIAGVAIRAPLLPADGLVLITRQPIPRSAGAEFS